MVERLPASWLTEVANCKKWSTFLAHSVEWSWKIHWDIWLNYAIYFMGDKPIQSWWWFLTRISFVSPLFRTAAIYRKSKTNLLSIDDCLMTFLYLVHYSSIHTTLKRVARYWQYRPDNVAACGAVLSAWIRGVSYWSAIVNASS